MPWAAQYGLIRPRHGRYLAGVGAALGRATGTDPLLWRVLLGVLAIFGIGIILYLAGWLLMPAEGDTASPVEAAFGRGYSSTSTAITLILAVGVVVLTGAITDSFFVGVLVAVGLLVAALVVSRNQNPTQQAAPPGYQPAWPPGQPAPYGPAMSVPPTVAAATYPQESPVTANIAPGAPVPPPAGQATAEPPGYRPPFAPYGPYQSTPPPPPVPPVLPLPPLPRESSILGRLIFSVGLLVLGGLGVLDLVGASVPGSMYFAVALVVVGLGLVVGAWYGRARGYIALGIILSLLVPMASAGEVYERTRGGQVTYQPASVEELQDKYEHRLGEATLDLRDLDFTGVDRSITVEISMGRFVVLLPENVDATVSTDVNFGDADVFDNNNGGVGVSQTYFDNGSDGPGGGQLLINLEVNFGHAEVTR